KRYSKLRIAVIGVFCLDRYLEIDPGKAETSIETGLTVHNIVRVRAQPGGAGTILNNLAALGVGAIYPVGFCGTDGEGYELFRALGEHSAIQMMGFLQSSERRTFTYCKPVVITPGKPPRELNRLDSKNWAPTPALIQGKLIDAVQKLATKVDGFILLDQVEIPETGVLAEKVLQAIGRIAEDHPNLVVLADSRRSLRNFPKVSFKMNRSEFSALTGLKADASLAQIKDKAVAL